MGRFRILFQGSHTGRSFAALTRPLEEVQALAAAIGEAVIDAGFDLILTGGSAGLDPPVGEAAVKRCERLGVDPRDRIRTYTAGGEAVGFGMVLDAAAVDELHTLRTFVIRESDALIALAGGRGTSDCVQKAELAGKPVFPIAICGGSSREEWERLQQGRYQNRTSDDLEFLADRSLRPSELAATIMRRCQRLAQRAEKTYSRRIFLVHGHDVALKLELQRLLRRLDFEPVVLHEQPDEGKTVIEKLRAELADVGFAFILLTPDDTGGMASGAALQPRARQNVIFEHGLLTGLLGASRVCAIVKEAVEVPSDLQGVLYKRIPPGLGLDSIVIELVRELKSAGYSVDANKIWSEAAG